MTNQSSEPHLYLSAIKMQQKVRSILEQRVRGSQEHFNRLSVRVSADILVVTSFDTTADLFSIDPDYNPLEPLLLNFSSWTSFPLNQLTCP